MNRIVGACLSQFEGDPENHELLIAFSDGREIGHVVSTDHAVSIVRDMANQLGMDDVSAFAEMVSALQNIKERLSREHPVFEGDLALKVVGSALQRALLVSTTK